MPPHLFRPDPDLPPDTNGRQVCRCGLVGAPGDGHHKLPEPVPDVQQLAAGDMEGSER